MAARCKQLDGVGRVAVLGVSGHGRRGGWRSRGRRVDLEKRLRVIALLDRQPHLPTGHRRRRRIDAAAPGRFCDTGGYRDDRVEWDHATADRTIGASATRTSGAAWLHKAAHKETAARAGLHTDLHRMRRSSCAKAHLARHGGERSGVLRARVWPDSDLRRTGFWRDVGASERARVKASVRFRFCSGFCFCVLDLCQRGVFVQRANVSGVATAGPFRYVVIEPLCQRAGDVWEGWRGHV